jgi:hypothetical protein
VLKDKILNLTSKSKFMEDFKLIISLTQHLDVIIIDTATKITSTFAEKWIFDKVRTFILHKHNNPVTLELIDKIKSVSLENLYEAHESRKRLIKYCVFLEIMVYNHVNLEAFTSYDGIEELMKILQALKKNTKHLQLNQWDKNENY